MLQIKENNFYYVFVVDAIEKRTEKALLLNIDDSKIWVARSQLIGWNDGINKLVALPYWVANNNGLLNTNWNGSHVHQFTPYTGQELREYLNEHGLSI